MPGFDRTGPEGKGSQTGRKNGRCNSEINNGEKENESSSCQQLGKRLRRHVKKTPDSENESGMRRGEGRSKRRGRDY